MTENALGNFAPELRPNLQPGLRSVISCCPPQSLHINAACKDLAGDDAFSKNAHSDAEPTLLLLRDIFEALSDPSFAIAFAIERRLAS